MREKNHYNHFKSLQSLQSLQSQHRQRQRFRFRFRLKSGDLQSDSDLDSIRNSCDVSFYFAPQECCWSVFFQLLSALNFKYKVQTSPNATFLIRGGEISQRPINIPCQDETLLHEERHVHVY